MKIESFKLERYFAEYEFSTKYLLSSSDCDGYSLEYILNCADTNELKLWHELKFGYTDSAGSLFLREAISAQYQNISENDVLVMSPGEANFILMNVVLNEGDEVICTGPAYQSLYQIAKDLGCNIKFWYPASGTTYFYDTSDLKRLITKRTKLLIINFPHNPTGFIPSESELNEIINIARINNILLFSDEMYHQLVHDRNSNIPSVCDLYENSVSLWGMAKSFGLAGLRLGWIATKRHDLIEKIVSFKDYLTICNNAAGEVLSYIALKHKEKFIEPNIEKIVRNKHIFMNFVNHNSDLLEFSETKAGSTALVKLKIHCSAYKYSEKLVKETGIMLVPSEMFEYGDKHVRIGFGRENFPEILNVWQKLINDQCY
ncbi:MAG: aminotransferase class I/II-fold pyridoxal phosphate-dependent enzyme [Bacteroidales bacterium]|jgi:aspartate/methionine/tyrosine aminotransferase|nr:aminotransferase class I/II-fold pyridoxal phosphate-dependent enzyme [Bacteroidales bacterium]